jgi:hypothetical protein
VQRDFRNVFRIERADAEVTDANGWILAATEAEQRDHRHDIDLMAPHVLSERR